MDSKNKNQKLKIIFMGTPEFGAVILESLISGGYPPDLVVTETDKPAGRKHIITPPPVKITAEKYGIPIEQPDNIKNSIRQLADKIKSLNPDVGIVAAYGQIIPKEILDIPKHDFLNVHPSLLPKYRGPSPIQSAILNNDALTGISIILLDEKLDHGPIVAFSNFLMADQEISYMELHDKLAELGGRLLIEIIPKWIKGEINPLPQNESSATYTKMLLREDGKINWQSNASEIERRIRAFNPWPGTYTQVRENRFGIKRIKIFKAKVKEQTKNGPFGSPGKTYLAPNDQIAVQTGKNFLVIEELQAEGGKKMQAWEFLNGRSDFIGTLLI